MTPFRLELRHLLSAIVSGTLLAGCGGSVSSDRTPTTDEPLRPGSGGSTSVGAGGSAPGDACEYGTPQTQCYTRENLANLVRFGGGQIPLDPPRSDAEVQATFLENGCVPKEFVFDGCCNEAVSGPTKSGEECCYIHCTGACCGRPLLVEGTCRVAPKEARGDWAAHNDGSQVHVDASSELLALIAHAWAEDALLEHASIASFARFSLELLSVGAPPSLVQDAQLAGLDEVEHARLCFGMAARFGATAGPGRLDLRDLAIRDHLATVAAAAVEEGCIGETLASLLASEQLRVATDAAARETLSIIAADEARHAELAWRFVAWAVRTGSVEVREAVRSAFAQGLARRLQPLELGLEERDVSGWHAAGRLTPSEIRAVEHEAKERLIAAAAQALIETPSAGAPRGGTDYELS